MLTARAVWLTHSGNRVQPRPSHASGDAVPRGRGKTPVWSADLIQLVPLRNLQRQLRKLSWFRLQLNLSFSLSFMAAGVAGEAVFGSAFVLLFSRGNELKQNPVMGAGWAGSGARLLTGGSRERACNSHLRGTCPAMRPSWLGSFRTALPENTLHSYSHAQRGLQPVLGDRVYLCSSLQRGSGKCDHPGQISMTQSRTRTPGVTR